MLVDQKIIMNDSDIRAKVFLISLASMAISLTVTITSLVMFAGTNFSGTSPVISIWINSIFISVLIPLGLTPLFVNRLYRTVRDLNIARLELDTIVKTDHLTGLLNRHGFDASSDELIARARTEHCTVAVLMCDIDHFKRVNDTFGHDTGDDAIRHVAQVLREVAKAHPAVTVGRQGGEEFVILATDMTIRQLSEFAEGIRVACAARPVISGDHAIPITISIGTAISTWDDVDRKDLLSRADAALYQAKTKGRNRVEAAKPLAVLIEAA